MRSTAIRRGLAAVFLTVSLGATQAFAIEDQNNDAITSWSAAVATTVRRLLSASNVICALGANRLNAGTRLGGGACSNG